MNILWFSNAPWAHTGYANQTDMFWWRIQQLGHKVTLGANYGLAGAPLNIERNGQETRVLPSGMTVHGNDIVGAHARQVDADIVVTLYDSWVFDNTITSKFRWCPWLPVDHLQVPEPVAQALKTAWQPIAYSKFGQAALKDAGIDALYVPHGVETNVFTPQDRDKARESLKLQRDDIDFLAVMVAANKGLPSRKSFCEVLYAWAEFVKDHPKAMLYLHTHAGPQMAGEDLIERIRQLGIPKENVIFCDPYWYTLGYSSAYMARLYSAADVLVNPATGEGFGIPIVEAQACGCPVIVSDWTSMPELCFAGWKVEGEPFPTPHGWQKRPLVGAIHSALCAAYDKRNYDKLRRDARKGALAYDADLVAEKYWKPALEQIAGDLDGGELVDLGAGA